MSISGFTEELIESKRIVWKIPNFLSLPKTKGSYCISPHFVFGNATWSLRIYPGGRNIDGFISLRLQKEIECASDPLNIDFSIKKIDGTLIECGACYIRGSSKGMICGKFCDRSVLNQNESEILPSGILTILCTLKLNQDEKQDIKKSDLYVLSEKDLHVLSENLKKLFTNEDSYDFILRVQGKEFKAHKAILIARSPVFATMLQPNTQESQKGVVEIKDCDPESFPQFLQYLYCGKLQDISFYIAYNLYCTSNKYDIQNLKEYCAKNLIQNLTVDNVCEVVILGDKCDDKKLSSAVQEFFTKNHLKIFETADWLSLMRDDHLLANKLLAGMSKN